MTAPLNPSLKGHKLAVLLGITGPPKILLGVTFRHEWVAEITELFPDLEVVTVDGVAWNTESFQDRFPDHTWKDVTVLVTGSALPTLDLAPKLQYVQLQSAGANHILDNPLIKDTGIDVCTASGVHGPQIAEWVVTTFLSFQHQIVQYVDFQRKGTWRKLEEPVHDAVNQRVGILGYGAVGRQVARVCKALGMDVHACTLHPRRTLESRRHDSYTPAGLGDPDGIFPSQWFSAETTAGLHEFLSTGLDLLVITTPLTAKTKGLISRRELALLATRKTFISNVSRGAIINTEDLIDALESDVIRGAAIDVTDPEPLPDGHRLWNVKNLFITPHISGDSSAYARRIFEILKFNLTRLSQGQELWNKFDRRDGY